MKICTDKKCPRNKIPIATIEYFCHECGGLLKQLKQKRCTNPVCKRVCLPDDNYCTLCGAEVK